MEKLFLQVTAQDYGQRVKETRKATVQKNKRKVVVDLELLGKLPPLRSYMCPLFFEAVPDFGWTLAPSRPTFRPSELQRARDSEPLHIKVGWPPFSCLTVLYMRIVESTMAISSELDIRMASLFELPASPILATTYRDLSGGGGPRHQPKAQGNAPDAPRHPASVSLGTPQCAISQSAEVDVVLESLIVTMAICTRTSCMAVLFSRTVHPWQQDITRRLIIWLTQSTLRFSSRTDEADTQSSIKCSIETSRLDHMMRDFPPNLRSGRGGGMWMTPRPLPL